jgi:hypothetical protein
MMGPLERQAFISGMLPDYVMGEDVDTTVDIQASNASPSTIPPLSPDVPPDDHHQQRTDSRMAVFQ